MISEWILGFMLKTGLVGANEEASTSTCGPTSQENKLMDGRFGRKLLTIQSKKEKI
jgi:hypothetical protein